MPHVRYLWDEIEDNAIEEYADNGNMIAAYTTEPTLYGSVISQNRDGVTRHYHFDGLGNTTELTNDTETITDTRRYSAFGEVAESSGSTEFAFKYDGRTGYYDDGVLNIYVRRRRYIVTMGRWDSADPMQVAQFDRHLLRQIVNKYQYCMSSPTLHVDPSGMLSTSSICDPCDAVTSTCVHQRAIVMKPQPQLGTPLDQVKCPVGEPLFVPDPPYYVCVICVGACDWVLPGLCDQIYTLKCVPFADPLINPGVKGSGKKAILGYLPTCKCRRNKKSK